MKVKTNELSGAQLDWAVAQCENYEVKFECNLLFFSDKLQMLDYGIVYHPSKDWEYGGPIIEREHIEWRWLPAPDKAHQYGARKPSLGGLNRTFCMDGPTILIAAMRCYVASKLGDEVEVPEEVCGENI